ncbi:CrcB-like protein [Paramagnetospirillum magnetotacticum MS-1]|uniref:Fluoride-specific ion channel FluC n=1 Tax=Paramagnetospirillum magnetotacticum MS-1 TaxID=272627 RepID=A0A0C2YZX4_PARME|nr:fluoride efflux transporter CrcB [Paramagnetospirillum magnetotacticum]KIM00634.1 CrcB-like protein [Paramagnetospirillum magnetotacticum MS-1]
MFTYALVALGSAIGGTFRYWLAAVIAETTAGTFPWGTLVVNVTGSAAIGLFATLTSVDGRLFVPSEWRTFFMVGICGGYTTFSSFSLQTLALAQDGDWLAAGLNVLGSVALCLVAVWLGHAAAAVINR